MADFNEPQLTSTYTSFLSTLKARDTDLAAMFANDAVSTSNWPARAVRFNTNSNKFQRRNSSNSGFEDLTSNHHFPAITIDGSGTLSVGGDITGASLIVTDDVTAGRVNVVNSTVPANGIFRAASNTLGIATAAAHQWTIDSDGRLFNNGQATHQGDTSSDLQIYNTAGARIDLLRVDTSVGTNNMLGRISAYTQENANDAFSACAHIEFRSEDAHTTNDHSSRIEFLTSGGNVNDTTPRTVGCFNQFGFLGVGENVGESPGAPLHVNSGSFTSDVAIFASDQTNNDATIGIRGRLNNNFDNRIHTEGSNMSFRVGGNATPAIALDSSGMVTINTNISLDFDSGGNPWPGALQVAGTDGKAQIVIGRGSANNSAPVLVFSKYRTNTYSLNTALQVNDVLGQMTFNGADGSNMSESHRIRAQIITPDFSGNTVAVGTGKLPVELQMRTRNNDGGSVVYMKIDHNGHIQHTPHSQPSGGGQNVYCIDLRTNNQNAAGNFLRFTNVDTTIGAGQFSGGIQFATADTNAQNSGLLGEITVEAESGTPHGIMRMKMAGTEHITIEGANNHLGIHRSDPEFPLDVVGNALFDGSVCVSTERAGFISMNESAALQVTGSSNARSMVNITRYGNNPGNFPTLVFTKNHNDSPSGNTTCPADSTLGGVEFQGANGTGFDVGARIIGKTGAAWDGTNHNTDLIFQVSNQAILNTHMCLRGNGVLNIGDGEVQDDYSTSGDARLVIIDASAPDVLLHRRDTSIGATNELGAIKCSDSDGGIPAPASASLSFRSAETHSATAKGTDIRMQMCANGTTTLTTRFTFRDSGGFGVNGDSVGSDGDCLISKGNAPPEYQPVGAKAFVNFGGTNGVITGGRPNYNVSSVDDNGVGDFTVNFTNSFPQANYAFSLTMGRGNTGDVPFTVIQNGDDGVTTDKFNLQCYNLSTNNKSDAANISAIFFDD
tara:strand:- start:1225 stop:4074 length:2850 start_codon:yes stop_codon:yes gene_type:complete